MKILICCWTLFACLCLLACGDEKQGVKGEPGGVSGGADAVFHFVEGGPDLVAFVNGKRAYTNRKYVLQGVPEDTPFKRFTQIAGGGSDGHAIEVTEAGWLYIAVSDEDGGPKPVSALIKAGKWKSTDYSYAYSAKSGTRMNVYRKRVEAGSLEIPRFNWSGPVVLLP